MDFFARQEQSRRRSRALVVAFLAAFVAVALVTTAAIATGMGLYLENDPPLLGTAGFTDWVLAHGGLLAGIAVGTFAAMLLASAYRAATLARGGAQVARMMGGTQISSETTDPLHRRLVNVVEEMALAADVPVPEIFVLENESAINAFAAGLNPADAAIAVTRGALERLERAELQGVIGHELSHIVNGDMRLNQQLIGMSFGILVLALVGRWLIRSARYDRRNRNGAGVAATLAIGIVLTVIGWIGVTLSRLIKAATSRERERLADASAVQFTRDTAGLAGALKKIAAHTGVLTAVETEEVAHMLFARGTRRALAGWFASHPPILERIKALEPSFDPARVGEAVAHHVADAPTSEHSIALAQAHFPDDVLDRAGAIAAPEIGSALRAALPMDLYDAAHSREASLMLACALALSPTDLTRERQLALLEQQLGADRARVCRRLHAALVQIDPRLKLPLLELAAPALRQRPEQELQFITDLLGRVAAIDAERPLLEFVLLTLLGVYLRLPARPGAERAMSPEAAVDMLLAGVAAHGHDARDAAFAAYRAGRAVLGADDTERNAEARIDNARELTTLGAALRTLADLPPRSKRRVLAAVLATIRHDHKVELHELELFRAIAAVLDCPLPPSTELDAIGTGSATGIR